MGPDVTTSDSTTHDETGAREGRTRIERYDPAAIEPRWQARWAELRLYDTDLDDDSRPRYYLLTMYPYPSGALHIGHWYIKSPTDAIARYRRMHGDNVFLPIGFDGFGLPAENAAIKNRMNPRDWTMANIETMRRQLRSMGATFAWDAEVVTCDPSYYRWNQWLFLKFLERGLAYRAVSPVDWCPNDGTLAREQVEGTDRRCWRCGAKVEKRELAAVVPADHRLRGRAARLLRHRLAGADPGDADELDRALDGRRDRVRDGARRRTTRAAASCACSRPARTRCSARRSWSSPRSTRWSRS